MNSTKSSGLMPSSVNRSDNACMRAPRAPLANVGAVLPARPITGKSCQRELRLLACDPKAVEPKWQAHWEEIVTFRATIDMHKPKYYVIDMFSYPSGAGLHVGHPEGYTATDIIARYKRMRGFNLEELGRQVLEDFDRELTDVVPDAEALLFDAQLGEHTSLAKLRHTIHQKVNDATVIDSVIDVLIWTGCIGVLTGGGPFYISDCGFKRLYMRSLIRHEDEHHIVFHPTLASIFATPATTPVRSAASRRRILPDTRQGDLLA